MRIQNLPAQRALSSLRSGQSGLTSAEISRRLGRFGLNLLEPTRRQPIAERFLRSFTHFFAVLLWLPPASP